MKIKITNIKWDTDGENVKLPKSLTITDSDIYAEDIDERLSDYLSDTYGFLHNGFEYEVIGDRQEQRIAALKREIARLQKSEVAFTAIADFLWEHKGCFADDQQKEIDELFDAL